MSFEIRKQTHHMGELIIRPVSKDIAKDLIIRGHYSHKWHTPFGLYNFGIYRAEDTDTCLGVAAYGYMKNSRAKIFTSDVPGGWMIELNRMWISDELGHNAESILIAASLRLLRAMDPTIVAVQSFADGRVGCGTIYKAANFHYYGVHKSRFFKDRKTGEIFLDQRLSNPLNKTGFILSNVKLLLGHLEAFDVQTYRYIYPFHRSFKFTAAKRQAYPPYDKGTVPVKHAINKALRIPRLLALIQELADAYPYTTEATTASPPIPDTVATASATTTRRHRHP